MQPLIWMWLEYQKLESCTFSYKWALSACLKVLAGKRSYSYTLTKEQSFPLSGKVVIFGRACSFGRDAHGVVVGQEGDPWLASQISLISPGDQWGGKGRSQVTLTSVAEFQFLSSFSELTRYLTKIKLVSKGSDLFHLYSHTPRKSLPQDIGSDS